jgi:hypothetical protein
MSRKSPVKSGKRNNSPKIKLEPKIEKVQSAGDKEKNMSEK